MRLDLLRSIQEAGQVTNAVILTHNIDFVFLQLIVVPALKKCGHPTLTVFADAQCAAGSYAYQAPVLQGLGARYRVVPVAMEQGFRFHPKAVLLSGTNKATLWVGSGNLTFGGWRENAETWTHFDSDTDGTAAFTAFRDYLGQIVGRIPVPDPVRDEIDEAFDPQTRPWADEMEKAANLLGKVGTAQTLLEGMREALGTGAVDRLVVCSPYFDADGEALRTVAETIRPREVEVLLQAKNPGLSRESASYLGEQYTLTPVRFLRTAPNGKERESFLHAKFYAAVREQEVTVFAGSANCSRAALTIPGRNGNAELLAYRTVSREEFEEAYLQELPATGEPLDLPLDAPDVDETPAGVELVRVLAARYDDGALTIGYWAAEGVEVTGCLVDDIEADVELAGAGLARVRPGRAPRSLILVARRNGNQQCSPAAWVDREEELRGTSRGRSLAGEIRKRFRPESWNIGALKDVLDVFYKHLQYMPTRLSAARAAGSGDRPEGATQFTVEDVFTVSYVLPPLRTTGIRLGGDGRIESLQRMVLRWFGVSDHEEDGSEEQASQTADADADGVDDGEEAVDAPARLASPVNRQPSKPPTDRERKLVAKALTQMTDEMTSEMFLSDRPPEYLAADLKIAAVLLRAGLREGWVNVEDFFECTRRIWSALFFSSPGPKMSSVGWIERRHAAAKDPGEFRERLASPELAAALAAWALEYEPPNANPTALTFHLARVLAVARAPWLWTAGGADRIAEELSSLLDSTECSGLPQPETERFRKRWLRLIRKGHALRAVESALSGQTVAGIRGLLREDEVPEGELLWQGSAGYCVTTSDCRRSQASSNTVPVRCLQGASPEAKFQPSFVIPLRALYREDFALTAAELSPEAREELRLFVASLEQLAPGTVFE